MAKLWPLQIKSSLINYEMYFVLIFCNALFILKFLICAITYVGFSQIGLHLYVLATQPWVTCPLTIKYK